jgi:hypothetical protein
LKLRVSAILITSFVSPPYRASPLQRSWCAWA